MSYTVEPCEYKSGRGAQICDGANIIATVHGTSYPIGSACQADVDLARVMAAAPEMLAALQKLVANWEANHVATVWDDLSSPNFDIDAARAAIAKAVQS